MVGVNQQVEGGGGISEHQRGAIICYPGLNLVQDMIVSQPSTNHKQMFTYCWEIFPIVILMFYLEQVSWMKF